MKWINVFMPGRLCLFGEHSDWASSYRLKNADISKGYAIVLGLDKGIYLRASQSERLFYSFDGGKVVFTHALTELKKNKKIANDFPQYVIASYKIIQQNYKIGGADIYCEKMDLPMKKGLASSAAICMGIIRVLNILYDLNISVEDEMELAYKAEKSTGSKCGKLDQICAYGPGLRYVEFDGENVTSRNINCMDNLNYLLVDLNGSKDTKKILEDLNSFYPNKNSESEKLFNALGIDNKNIIDQAEDYINRGYHDDLGGLMNEAQGLFDSSVAPFSYEELKAEKLHQIINYYSSFKNVLGVKGVGSQGDGTAQILVKSKKDLSNLKKHIKDNFNMKSVSVRYVPNDLKAIIPIAGKGTRLLPITKYFDKASLPIFVNDKVYPVLFLMIKELNDAKIKEVNLVIRKDQKKFVKSLISEARANEFSIKISTSFQEKKSGFGGAIGSSKLCNKENNVLILLGDYIYKSNEDDNCTVQFMKTWYSHNKPLLSIKKVDINEASNYGIVKGEWIEKNLLKVTGIIEKPTKEYIMDNLLIKDEIGESPYCIFGQYILPKEITKKLSKIKDNSKSEIGLTEYISDYLIDNEIYATLIDGNSYDVGIPAEYYKTFCEFNNDKKNN